MILHYENAVVRIHENEARDDCTASQSVPVPVTSSRELEIVASHCWGRSNFKKIPTHTQDHGDA